MQEFSVSIIANAAGIASRVNVSPVSVTPWCTHRESSPSPLVFSGPPCSPIYPPHSPDFLVMDAINKILCGAGILVKRARTGDLAVIGGISAVVGVGLYYWLHDGDCARHMSDDQKAFSKSFIVTVGGKEITVNPVNFRTVDDATASVAKAYAVDPLINACTQEVGSMLPSVFSLIWFFYFFRFLSINAESRCRRSSAR